MENAKKTISEPTSDPDVNKVISQLTSDKDTVNGLWKQVMSFVGFAAGLVGGYFFFGVAKNKEIKLLEEQVGQLKQENKRLSAKLKKRKEDSVPSLSSSAKVSNAYFLD